MVATDHDRRADLLLRYEPIEEQSRFVALTVAEPADPGGQSLKLDALLGHADPAMQRCIIGEELENRFIGHKEIVRIAGKCRPAERTFSLAEERPDEQRNEAPDIERVLHTGLQRLSAEVVAVVEGDCAAVLQLDHRA